MTQLQKTKQVNIKTLIWLLFFFFLISAPSISVLEIKGIGNLNFFRISAIILAFYALCVSKKIFRSKIFKTTIYIFLIFLIFCFVSLRWANNKHYGITYAFNYFLCIIFMLSFICFLLNKRNFERSFLYCGHVMIFFSLLGVFETLTGKYIFEAGQFLYIKGPYGLFTPVAAFGNPNDFVFAQLSVMPFFFFALNKYFKHPTKVILKFIYVLLILYISLAGRTRITIPVLLFMTFIRVLCIKRFRIPIVATVLTIVCVFILSESFGITNLTQKIASEARILIWIAVYKNLKGHILLGRGAGNGQIIDATIENPHFWFLELFADFGLVIVSVLVFWFVYVIRMNIRLNDRYSRHSDSATCIVYLLSLLPMSIMSSSISFSPILWICISFTALLTVKTMASVNNKSSTINNRMLKRKIKGNSI